MSDHPLTWLDVFTSTPFAGNQLAVVHDADDLDDAAMLRVARETALSETTFVQSPQIDGVDYRNRIWTMRGEIPFAGHPTLGTAAAEALRRGADSARFVQETPSGLQPVEVEVTGARTAHVATTVAPATFGDELELDAALRPDPDHRFPAQLVGTGVPQITAPVRSLDHLPPTFEELELLLATHDALTLYWVILDEDGDAYARSFGVDPNGINEDAATGSSAAPLMAYLHARTGSERLTVHQGASIGRPSVLTCSIDGDGQVRLEGDAVVVGTGVVDV